MATVTRQAVALGIALALLGATALVLYGRPEVQVASGGALLERMPRTLGPWGGVEDVPPGILEADGGASGRLRRAYQDGMRTVWIAVDYYPDQREGHRPQALRLLYPGAGWSDLRASTTQIALDGPGARALPVTRIVMRRESGRIAVVYWYQVGAHPTASEHWYRALVLFNRLVHRRPDSALVRVASPQSEGVSDTEVLRWQQHFIQRFYPELVRRLS